MMDRFTVALKTSAILRFAGLLGCALTFAGCALTDSRVAFEDEPGGPPLSQTAVSHAESGVVLSEWRKPQLNYNWTGEVTTFKRYELAPQRDLFHRFFRQAYHLPGPNFAGDGADQATILTEWGAPDYVRKSFKSLQYERVEEWVYLDEFHIFQFVKNEMVYDGPLTDFEQTLMRYGYPDRMTTIINEKGRVIHTMLYKSLLLPGRLVNFYFSNDALVQTTQGN
jgi:hypothetical protein